MRNRFHSICPYFAMFPETFAELWIDRLTRRGDTVLDPFCGRGTAPFQALLMGRAAIANDVNPVAYCVTAAKLQAPTKSTLLRRVCALERGYSSHERSRGDVPSTPFFKLAFNRTTLRELAFLRRELAWRTSRTDRMIAALTLGVLHGESRHTPMCLSNQMPRTISTKPDYSVRYWRNRMYVPERRETFDILRKAIEFRYASEAPRGDVQVIHGDMRRLAHIRKVLAAKPRCVVTSPPYLDVTRYEEDQWLRLWFLGGAEQPTYGKVSQDDRHTTRLNYVRFLADMWRMLSAVLGPRAEIAVRIGAVRETPEELTEILVGAAHVSPRRVRLVSTECSTIKNRQTGAFIPNAPGCRIEVDCHLVMK